MALRTTFINEPVGERTSSKISATIKDPDGVGFKPETLVFTLYDQKTGDVIHDKSRVSILNENNGSVSVSGALVLELAPLDNVIVTDSNLTEVHILYLEWTWDNGDKQGWHEIHITVVNQTNLPVV